ncbi:hypothetical protein B0H19DRAFT_1317064 [Mycena capillaripes]|nr:hypothetical protein B0H19DRAFT_1317064 [Mycena capillaripes]
MIMKSTFFTLIAVAAVSAVSIPRADGACGSAIQAVLNSPDGACVNPTGLNAYLALASSSQNLTDDVVKSTVETWLTGYCALGSCTSDTIDRVVKNVSASCGSYPSIGAIGAPDYALVRQMMCFKDNTAGKFCLTESIKNVGIPGASPDLMILGLVLASGPQGSTCNECTKARYQLTVQAGDASTNQISDVCGADFISKLNGTVNGVTQTAVSGDFKSANSPSGALAKAPHAAMGVLLLAMSGFFALL